MEWKQRILKIIDNLDDVVVIAVEDAANQLKGDIQEDTHTQGIAADGAKIGQYKNGYYKTNRAKTKQVAFVDLSVTNTLRNSQQSDKDSVFFSNTYGEIVGRGNEDRYRGGGVEGAGKGEIYGLNEKRREWVFEILNFHISELING